MRFYLLLLGGLLTLLPSFAPAAPAPPPADVPEAMLLKSVDTLRQGDFSAGIDTLESLVKRHPNFRLAQLLYGQLLAERSGVASANRALISPEAESAIHQLRAQYRARLATAGSTPAAGQVPNNILKLAPAAPYAVVVDLRRSRLYLLAHDHDSLQVLRSYYATIARDGYGKRKRGDMRTPVGVYHITSWKPGDTLGAIYGAGAFPVNYPNAWDRDHHRTGYGIWLHGVPRNAYARPPRDSEGCVALANPDLLALKPYLHPGSKVPVIFSDDLKWQPAADNEAERKAVSQAVEGWRKAWSARDIGAFLAYYAPGFHTASGVDRAEFAQAKRHLNTNKSFIDVAVNHLNLFRYPGTSNVVLAQFTQVYKSSTYTDTAYKQQYWQRQADGQWQIVLAVNGTSGSKAHTK